MNHINVHVSTKEAAAGTSRGYEGEHDPMAAQVYVRLKQPCKATCLVKCTLFRENFGGYNLIGVLEILTNSVLFGGSTARAFLLLPSRTAVCIEQQYLLSRPAMPF